MKSVIVEWIDITKKMSDDSFCENQNIDDMILPSMKTIGWLYKETDKNILLVQEFEGDKPHDWIIIPKVLIMSKEEIE